MGAHGLPPADRRAMSVDLSILLVLRDLEPAVAGMVRDVADLAAALPGPPSVEILALDEQSGDNTLSVLSILHSRVPELRTLQDIARGHALQLGARVARGRTWLCLDHPVPPELLRWALRQVHEHGLPAALVPGEVLAVTARVGAEALPGLRGGLSAAQTTIERALRRRGDTPAWRPAPHRGVTERALHYLRARLGRLGLAPLDRPLGN